MKPESDFSFSEPSVETTRSTESSLQLPFALLTCTIAVLMIAQTVSTFKQRSALEEGQSQLKDAFKKREVVVKQSVDLQTKLQDLIMDLLILAKTDDEAKQIVGKYNIQQQGPPSAPAPAESPAK
jgi:hypothetical protein